MDLKKAEISFYPSVYDHTPKTITFLEFSELICGGEYSEQVSKVRKCKTKAEKDAEKLRLPIVTLSGTFAGGHSATNLKRHSGLICMDFDAKDNPALKSGAATEIRDLLAADPYCAFAFVSAGGNGVAALCKINPAKHSEAFEALSDYFFSMHRLQADKQCSDICRPRFISWDDEAKINPTAKRFPCTCIETIDKPIHSIRSIHVEETESKANVETATASRILQSNEIIQGLDKTKGLRTLYDQLITRNFTAKSGERNNVVVKQATFLFHAVNLPVAKQFIEAFYWEHSALTETPIRKHLYEAISQWDNCTKNYAEELNHEEKAAYQCLVDENEQALFRICRDLAASPQNGYEDGLFPLSEKQCSLRLGVGEWKAREAMKRFNNQYGIIRIENKGTQYISGSRPRATVYRWTLTKEVPA